MNDRSRVMFLYTYFTVALLAGLVLAAAGCSILPALAGSGNNDATAFLANPEIAESSGIAAGRLDPGVFWTHNDSGDTPRLFAFDLSGRDLGVYTLAGASAVDWEDMASFRDRDGAWLLIADMGDNLERRDHCSLYLVREPEIVAGGQGRGGRVEVEQRIDFRYEDGPRDCEGVAVDAEAGIIYLVSKKSALAARVYGLSLKQKNGQIAVARAVASVPIDRATAMDISPKGDRAVILTYINAFEYQRQPGQAWPEAFKNRPTIIPMPGRKQGESICYGAEGKWLYLTSEGSPAPLWKVGLKD